MSYSRPGNYPYPERFKSIEDAEAYAKKMYAALLEKDNRADYMKDRSTDKDLKELIVRPEWYGAKGDGVTDDTVAIQAAADSLTSGQMLVFQPGKTYKTKTIYIHTSDVWVGCIGGQATISLYESTGYCILVHGGTISAENRTYAYFSSTCVVSDYNNSRIHGVTVENLKTTAYTTTKNTSIALMWADDCRIINCETEESDGNGYDIRQCRRPFIRGCKSTSPAAYNIFVFQCSNARIENNFLYGGTLGIELKHRYNDEPCNHILTGNNISEINGFYISGGYNMLATNTAPYYIGSYEIVDNVTIQNNRLVSTISGGGTCPRIAICTYADNWRVIGNVFDGGGIGPTGLNPLYIGTLGDWWVNGNTGTPGDNHILDGNVFNNMIINHVFDVGCSCQIINNIINCNIRMGIEISETQRLYDNIRLFVCGNTITAMKLSFSGSSGLIDATSYVELLECYNNEIRITPTDNDTKNLIEGIRTSAVQSIICGNSIYIAKGSANHEYTYGIIVAGEASVVSDNYVAVDAVTLRVGIYVLSGATADCQFVNNNIVRNLGESSGSVGIWIASRSYCYYNKAVGTWASSVSDSTGGSGYGLGTRRHVYSTVSPTSGSWNVGDICYKINSDAGDVLGWYCIATGSPGTWSPLANVGWVTQDLRTSASPTFANPVVTTLNVGSNKVVGARVVDSRLADTPDSGDATTNGIIDALRDLVIAHGLGSAT